MGRPRTLPAMVAVAEAILVPPEVGSTWFREGGRKDCQKGLAVVLGPSLDTAGRPPHRCWRALLGCAIAVAWHLAEVWGATVCKEAVSLLQVSVSAPVPPAAGLLGWLPGLGG